jgi:hypothetical protein
MSATMTTSAHFTPPPRRVPLSIAVLNRFNAIAQIGWFVFGFGMIFFWAFGMNGDFSFLTFRGNLAQAMGRVTRVEDTSASEGGSHVRANHYEYSVAGQRFQGTSYSTGASKSEGEAVKVEYKESNPEKSRIEGMRRKMFGPGVAFVTIFPLIGFGILFFATRSGANRTHLLQHGVFTTGKLIAKEATNVTVNKRRVIELTFEFISRDGRRCEAKARTTDPSRLEDDAQEPLLYDPQNPEKAYVLDELPARPAFNGLGEIEGRPTAAIASLILPAIVVAGHGYIALVKMGVLSW